MARLPTVHLRLVIATAIVDKLILEQIIDRLFREDPAEVRDLYYEIKLNRMDLEDEGTGRPTKNDRIKAPILTRNKVGVGVTQIAQDKEMNRETLVALMEHQGYLELVPCGPWKRKYLVTDAAYHAGLGHNVHPSNRIAHLEGYSKASSFPVFYPDTLDKLFWTLNYSGIKSSVMGVVGKKAKLSWLLQHHAYLPDAEIATLAGYSRMGVFKARADQSTQQAA